MTAAYCVISGSQHLPVYFCFISAKLVTVAEQKTRIPDVVDYKMCTRKYESTQKTIRHKHRKKTCIRSWKCCIHALAWLRSVWNWVKWSWHSVIRFVSNRLIAGSIVILTYWFCCVIVVKRVVASIR